MSPSERTEFLRQRFEELYGDRQFIYALNEPDSGARRYVGRTNNPQHRFNLHLQKARQRKHARSAPASEESHSSERRLRYRQEKPPSSKEWIAELIQSGRKPALEILETVHPSVRVCEREMRWISQSIKEGHDIFNAENSSDDLKKLICQEAVESFLSVSLDELIESKFPNKIEDLLGGRDTGWRRAVLIHFIYKSEQLLTTKSSALWWYD
jgi:hypothetical protein